MSQRKRRYMEKKPLSTGSVVEAVVALISIVLLVVLLFVMAWSEGKGQNLYGGLAVLGMLAALISLIRGYKHCKNENFEKISRLLGVIVPLIATILWMLVYIIGIFKG